MPKYLINLKAGIVERQLTVEAEDLDQAEACAHGEKQEMVQFTIKEIHEPLDRSLRNVSKKR
jgi:hypothetical protein